MGYMAPKDFAVWRRRMGLGDDGPITSPSQVDDSMFRDSAIMGTIGPTRVPCASLPADSPWKRPGQVCAPEAPSSIVEFFKGMYDKIAALSPLAPEATAAPSAESTTSASSGSSLLVLAAIGGVGYYLLTRKKRA